MYRAVDSIGFCGFDENAFGGLPEIGIMYAGISADFFLPMDRTAICVPTDM